MRFFNGPWLRGLLYGTAVLWALACTSSESNGDDDSAECKPGTERCDCKDGACDAGLECLSDVCVKDTSGGNGGAPTGGAGGTTGGGQSGASGATPAGGKGGTGGDAAGAVSGGGGAAGSASGRGGTGGGSGGDTAGTTGTGGDASGVAGAGGSTGGTGGDGGSAGMSGAGGSAGTCTADLQTDPNNCGGCGKVCRYEAWGRCNDACCQNGACLDGFGDCIRESDGFVTCEGYCSSIGEQCVQQGCGKTTYRGWGTPDSCAGFVAEVADSMGGCDEAIDYGSTTVRCCCTDTQ